MVNETLKKYFGQTETKSTHYIDLIILIFIFLASLIYVIDTYELPDEIQIYIDIINFIIVIIFSLEILIRFLVAKKKKTYFKSLYTWIDILAVIPFWFGLRSFQILRLFRFFKIVRYTNKYLSSSKEGSSQFISGKNLERVFILRIIFLLFCILFVASSFILLVEKGINPKISTFGDAFYFSLVSITTVGFGDVVPYTKIGRMITILVISLGLLVIPWNTGLLIKHIVYSISKVKVVCPKCGLMYHDRDAKYCKNCATRIYIEYKKPQNK
jgi:voltage-gated potassium channel